MIGWLTVSGYNNVMYISNNVKYNCDKDLTLFQFPISFVFLLNHHWLLFQLWWNHWYFTWNLTPDTCNWNLLAIFKVQLCNVTPPLVCYFQEKVYGIVPVRYALSLFFSFLVNCSKYSQKTVLTGFWLICSRHTVFCVKYETIVFIYCWDSEQMKNKLVSSVF